jgi:site-specific recombinase XerD
MKTEPLVFAPHTQTDGWPDAAELAALRAWYSGVASRDAAHQYLAERIEPGQSSRSVISAIKRRLVAIALHRGRHELAQVLQSMRPGQARAARLASQAIEALRIAPMPSPLIGDDVDRWLPPRLAKVLRAAGIKTLASLTLKAPRRKRWWTAVPGLGAAGAARIESFFAEHPFLTERARALVALVPQYLPPWERLVVPELLDGSQGAFRAPPAGCALSAANDYQAVHAWLSLHEADATKRAYRKEAERLILWAVYARGRALSSLSTEDAVAYRAFLRQPSPAAKWIGPACPRSSPEWKPFAGGLSARSAAYAISVLGAMFRWLIEKRYVLANPFAGVKVRGTRPAPMNVERVFTEGEWNLLRTVADGLEWSYGWEQNAAQRLRFILDFAYATGMRAQELVRARLADIEVDAHGDHWINVIGKGAKPGKVVMPPLARSALDQYLLHRRLPTTPSMWRPTTALIESFEGQGGITTTRLWSVMKRFFSTAAEQIEEANPALATKLRLATPHWMRHTHATHALDAGADLTTVRDNLRHASISTTSMYLHADNTRRAKQLEGAFAARRA